MHSQHKLYNIYLIISEFSPIANLCAYATEDGYIGVANIQNQAFSQIIYKKAYYIKLDTREKYLLFHGQIHC